MTKIIYIEDAENILYNRFWMDDITEKQYESFMEKLQQWEERGVK